MPIQRKDQPPRPSRTLVSFFSSPKTSIVNQRQQSRELTAAPSPVLNTSNDAIPWPAIPFTCIVNHRRKLLDKAMDKGLLPHRLVWKTP